MSTTANAWLRRLAAQSRNSVRLAEPPADREAALARLRELAAAHRERHPGEPVTLAALSDGASLARREELRQLVRMVAGAAIDEALTSPENGGGGDA